MKQVKPHSPNLTLLHLCQSSFSNVPPLYLHHSSFYSPSIASPTSQALHLRHSSFSNPSAALHTSQHIVQPFRCFTYIIGTSPMSQVILQPFRCFTYITGTSCTSPGEPSMHRGMKNSVWWTSLLQQVTKFRSSYSFGQLLRILLRAVNLYSFSHIVSSDSSFNIHNALYFVKYPSRAAG